MINYNLIERRLNVKGVKIASASEIVGYSDGQLFVNATKIAEGIDTVSNSMKICKNFLLFFKENYTGCYDLIGRSLYEIVGFTAYPFSMSKDTLICTYNTDYVNGEFTWNTGLINFKENRLIKEYSLLKNTSIAYADESSVIIYTGSGLGKIQPYENLYLWRTELENVLVKSNGKQIEKISGIYKSKLWVCGGEVLLGLNIETGEVIHRFVTPSIKMYESDQCYLDTLRANDAVIDEEKQLLYGLEHNTYYEIKLDEAFPTLRYWIFEKECKELHCYAPHSYGKAYTDTHIFFIDKMNFTVGAFKRDSKQLELIYKFPKNSCTGFLNEIQVNGDKLYVLDTGGTLHVFERKLSADIDNV